MFKRISHKVYQYTAIFEPDTKSGGFTVTIPALPGCISEGDTFEEALDNIKEAASLYLEVMKEQRTGIPQEDLESYANPERIKLSFQNAIEKYPPNHAVR